MSMIRGRLLWESPWSLLGCGMRGQVRQGGGAEIRVRVAEVCGEVRFLPPVTIHQFPLDVDPCTFYSVRIFDTLALLANPVAVPKRTICAATNPRLHFIQSPRSFGTYLTRFRLTEVSTLLD